MCLFNCEAIRCRQVVLAHDKEQGKKRSLSSSQTMAGWWPMAMPYLQLLIMIGVIDTAYLKVIAAIILCNPSAVLCVVVLVSSVCRADKLTKPTKEEEEEEMGCGFLGLDPFLRGPKQCLWRPPYTAQESSMFLRVHELPALDSTIASQLPSLRRQ